MRNGVFSPAMAGQGLESSRLEAVWRNACAALPFAVVITLVGILTDSHTPLNDFWGNYALSQRLDPRHLETFYDGFFPVGYTVLLRLLSRFGYPPLAALGINAALTWLLAFALLGVFRLRGLGLVPSLIAALLVFLFPQVFDYLYTPGADSGAMVFFTVGTCVLMLALLTPTPRRWWYVLAGGLLGMASLWRYHALLAGVFLMAGASLAYRKRIAGILLALASCVLVYGGQIAVNVLSRHSPFQTYQAFNIYQHMFPVNWYRTAEIPALGTPLSIVLSNPSAFLSAYVASFVRIFPILTLPLIFCLFSKDSQLKRPAAVWLCFCLFYSGVMATADSGRAVLLGLPVSLTFLLVSVHALWVDRLRTVAAHVSWPRRVSYVALVLLLGACATKDITTIASWRTASQNYRALEQVLVRERITDAQQVYSTDLYFYFRGIPPFRPSYSGGWLDLPLYHASHDTHGISLASENAFIQDCRLRGIRIVHLTPRCKQAAPFLFRIYTRGAESLRFIAQVGRSRLFRLD
jgi:hypothetical protein